MGNASSSSGRSHSDSDSESDHDMDDLYGAVHSAVVGGGNRIAVGAGNNSIAVGAGNSSGAAGQLAMRHSIHYDVTKFVTYYDAINVFGLKFSNLKGLKYQRQYIPGVSRHGMRLGVSHHAITAFIE
jgi:hypothetical protein